MRALTYLGDVVRNRLGLDNQPRFLTYIVTFNCNARCIMCDCWKKHSRDDLRLEEIERIFRQFPRLDAVRLTGGEPFVRSDLLEIAHLAQRILRPLVLHVTTNGFLGERILDFCEQRHRRVPLRLLVSLDGVGEKHNQVRGRSYAWDTAFGTIQALASRQRELRLKLSVNQVVVDADGLTQYRALRDLLKPLGVPVSVVMGYSQSATYSLSPEIDVAPQAPADVTLFGQLAKQDITELLAEIEKDTRDLGFAERIMRRYCLRGARQRHLHEVASPQPPCVALNSHLRLYPDGTVPICQFNSRKVGSLRRDTLRDLWASAGRREARQWVRACPGCWAECEVVPNALYTGDLLNGWKRPPQPQPRPAVTAPSGVAGIARQLPG